MVSVSHRAHLVKPKAARFELCPIERDPEIEQVSGEARAGCEAAREGRIVLRDLVSAQWFAVMVERPDRRRGAGEVG